MQIEVIVNGKGSIAIVQKCDLDRKGLERLAAHCTELLKGANKHQRIGFESGTSLDTEVSETR